MNLPRHINLTIEHQPHAADYESVEEWLASARSRHLISVQVQDAAEMLRTGEIWVLSWYPDTMGAWHGVAAATLDRCLALAAGAA